MVFRQRFNTIEEFTAACYERRGLNLQLLHFILQEQDHEMFDECVRILLRTGRWDASTILEPDSTSPNVIPAQFPYQDEAFRLVCGLNAGYQPSSPKYPLMLFFQQGNPLILETLHILRANILRTEDEFNTLLQNAPIRRLQHQLLSTKHYYTRNQQDQFLYAEMICIILSDPHESLQYWTKFDQNIPDQEAKHFGEEFPQFSEMQLNQQARYRLINAIATLPHPRLLALLLANRAEGILNRAQTMIHLERRHISNILSLMIALDDHIQKLYEARNISFSSYLDFCQTQWVEKDEKLNIQHLIPQGYISQYNIGSNNPLGGGYPKFSSYDEELEMVQQYYNQFKTVVALLFHVYEWNAFPAAIQVSILIMAIYTPHILSYLPWYPLVETDDDNVSGDHPNEDVLSGGNNHNPETTFQRDNLTIQGLENNSNNAQNISSTRDIIKLKQQEGFVIMSFLLHKYDKDQCDKLIMRDNSTSLSYERHILEPFEADLFQRCHDNRRALVPIINFDIYGADVLIVAPEFLNDIATDSKLSTLPIAHSKVTRTNSTNNSNSNNNDNNNSNYDPIEVTTTDYLVPSMEDSSISTTGAEGDDAKISTDISYPSTNNTEDQTLEISPPTFLLSCLPEDQHHRKPKRTVHFDPNLLETSDAQPMSRRRDDLAQWEEQQRLITSRNQQQTIRFILCFATQANLTAVLDYVLDDQKKTLNDLMMINPQGSAQQTVVNYHRNFFPDNLLALALHTPHVTPYTMRYLFSRRSKLCTNNKSGRENNAFLAAYRSDQYWVSPHLKFAKLLLAWKYVKDNERVYKPHVDYQDFLLTTVQQALNNGLLYYSFVFILEHLLSPTDRNQFQHNAIRICEVLNFIYVSPSLQSSSAQYAISVLGNNVNHLAAGNGWSAVKQFVKYPAQLTLQDAAHAYPLQKVNLSGKYCVFTPAATVTTTHTTPITTNFSLDMGLNLSFTPSLKQVISEYSNLPPLTMSLRDAYALYESQERLTFLQYFINKSTIGLFLPPSDDTLVLSDFPQDLFQPGDNDGALFGSDSDLSESDTETCEKVASQTHSNSLSSSPPQKSDPSLITTTNPASGDDNTSNINIDSPNTASPSLTTVVSTTLSKPPTKQHKLPNVQLWLDTCAALHQINHNSLKSLNILSPITLHDITAPTGHSPDLLKMLSSSSSPGGSPSMSPAPAPTIIAGSAITSQKNLPRFLSQKKSSQNVSGRQVRGGTQTQRDHLQTLIYPLLESRDIIAVRYILDLGITATNMWQRLFSVQHMYTDIRDIVDYIPDDLIDNQSRYNVAGLLPASVVNNNPWLTIGVELTKMIEDAHVEITGDFSGMPPLGDVGELLAQTGMAPDDLFGFHSVPQNDNTTPTVFESPNQIPYLSHTFLTTPQTSPFLQMLQLFILYDNSLHETSLSVGARNLSTTALITNCWPVVQTLYLSNTDTVVPTGEFGKYAHSQYIRVQSAINGATKEFSYNLDHAPFFKHDLIRIFTQGIKDNNNITDSGEIIANLEKLLPPRVYNKITNPVLENLRKNHLYMQFTPSFHLDFLSCLLILFLPSRTMNPIQEYYSMNMTEFVFSHVLREMTVLGNAQKQELMVYLRRSLVLHSFLPPGETELYEGPIEKVIQLTAQHSKEMMVKAMRFKDQVYTNSIKTLYRYNLLLDVTKPTQPEYVFLFTQVHKIHSALLIDWFHNFVINGGDYNQQLPLLSCNLLGLVSDLQDGPYLTKFVEILTKLRKPFQYPPVTSQ